MLEGIIDRLIHPPFGLTLTFEFEVTRIYSIMTVLIDHIKDLLNSNRIVATVGKHFRLPSRLCLGEELQRIAEVGSGESCSVYILSVGFIYDNTICHLHDSPFDPLQFVSGTGKLDEQKKSTIECTAVSLCPTPTVSTKIVSNPAASHKMMVSRVFRATPPTNLRQHSGE